MKISLQDINTEIFTPGYMDKNTPFVLVILSAGEGREVRQAYQSRFGAPCNMAFTYANEWQNTLSPWYAEKVFRGGQDFGNGADAFIKKLESVIVPKCKSYLNFPGAKCFIAGYSFAGLFALYSLYKTDIFDGAASVSGSLWFPGFYDFVKERDFLKKPSKIYLSLGSRESHTKNSLLASNEKITKKICAFYNERSIDCRFEMNPGNHFKDTGLRTAKGIRALLE